MTASVSHVRVVGRHATFTNDLSICFGEMFYFKMKSISSKSNVYVCMNHGN